MCNTASLEQLARRFGINTIPDSWFARWEAFRTWRSAGKCGDLRWELPANAAEVFSLPDESPDALKEMYKAIREDAQLTELADFWHYMVYDMPDYMERNTNIWDMPRELGGTKVQVFYLAVMVSGADHALENFAKTGVSEEIAKSTLSYIGRYAMDIKQKRGVWGLESVGWLSNYPRANIFRLGRLTFKAGESPLPFRVFRNRITSEIVTLCEPSTLYRSDGVADGSNNVCDPNAWRPILEFSNDGVTGNPVSDHCTALRETVTLPADTWEQLIYPDAPIIEVHIAAGSRLLREECIESFRAAVEFFPAYYPDTKSTGFTCSSWLFDPSFPKILSPDSNIVQFQRLFHVVPTFGNSDQAYDTVYGDSSVDPTTIPTTTGLQRAISQHVVSGGEIRSASAYITWDEAAVF